MSVSTLIWRNLCYFWRTNLAVMAGVAVAVGILAGALVVGDSVRGSLRTLFLSRLGRTDEVVTANRFFRAELSAELEASESIAATAPVIAFEGMVRHDASGRGSSRVQVYGVDERFFRFNEWDVPELGSRDGFITDALAAELGAAEGDALLLRVEKPTAVAAGSLHGNKEDAGRTLRLTARHGSPEFSIYPQQGELLALYVPLARLQRELDQRDRANTVLIAGSGSLSALERAATLEDLGLAVRPLPARSAVAVETEALMLGDGLVETIESGASEMEFETASVFTYLANTMRVGNRETPYSLVTALDPASYRALLDGSEPVEQGIVVNEWLAEDLGARVGDALEMKFYVWEDEGRIVTEEARFVVARIVPMRGLAADRDLAPDFPGISEAENLGDWDPPFPIDFRRVRDKDEQYWDDHRATPKAFIPLEHGQALWPVRQGQVSSVRLLLAEGQDAEAVATSFRERLRGELDVASAGYTVLPVREQGIAASRGATDFGEYFIYFSYFLMMSALILTGLFFKLGVEQRIREIGTLLAMGFDTRRIRRIFLVEGIVLAALGGALGVLVALGYAWIIMYGLRTWWVDAVGTRLLTLHLNPASLVLGVAGGVVVAALAIALTLRSLKHVTARSLLMASTASAETGETRASSRRAWMLGTACLVLSVGLLVAAVTGAISQVAGFFGAGNLLLIAFLTFQWIWLRSERARAVETVLQLGFRNVTWRPGRSLAAIALIAFATFIIVAVDAFRKGDASVSLDPNSGSGGYSLVAESLLPLHWDPNTDNGRDELNLPLSDEPDGADLVFQTFRLRPGDDASCLNLYRPQNPRILAPVGNFIRQGRFRFAASLAGTAEEQDNPWLLLEKEDPSGAIPFIGDANSMAYVLHLGLGDEFLLARTGEEPVRLRLVATLSDSIFQSELLVSETHFLRDFPGQDGFRFFLVNVPAERQQGTIELLEQRLADFGVDAQSTAEKLAGFHRVENTYLSTFQSLGGLGLVLGTLGLAAILLRNVLERRRELALLRAVGYDSADFVRMILAENVLLLFLGLLTGGISAVIAIAPALATRGGQFAVTSLGLLLFAVVVSGVAASLLAVGATLGAPLLASLRAE